MIDRVKSFREPATVIAIVVVLVGIAVTSGRIATGLQDFPLAQVLRGIGGLYGLVDALVLTVLALSCAVVRPVTRHAAQITLAASLLLWLGVLAGVAFLVISMFVAGEGSFARVLESNGGLTDITLRVLMAYALVLARRVASEPVPVAAVPAQPDATTTPVVTQDPARRPTWQSDEATGVVWRSAADAASGAAAGTYGGSGRGWQVDPQGPETVPLPEPTARPQAAGPRIILPAEDGAEPRTGPPSWDPAADVTRRDLRPPQG